MKKKLFKIFLILFFIFLISFFLIILLNNKIMPIYVNYAEGEMERVVTTVINKSVSECSFEGDLFLIKNDSNGTTMVDYDPVVLNRIISTISNTVYENIKLLSKMDLDTLKKYDMDLNAFYIPSFIIFQSILLNNLGPKIPVKLELINSVNSSVETKVTEYGINNSLIEVSIKVNSSVRMILPTTSKNLEISVVVPLTVKIIQGNIPEYYFGNLRKSNS